MLSTSNYKFLIIYHAIIFKIAFLIVYFGISLKHSTTAKRFDYHSPSGKKSSFSLIKTKFNE